MMRGFAFLARAGAVGVTTLSAAAGLHPARAQNAPLETLNQITINLDVEHDSNVARADRVRAAQRGLQRADSIFSPSVGIKLARPLFGAGVQIDGSIGYDFYRRNTRLDRERIAIGGQLALDAGPCRVTLSPGFQRRQSDLSEISIVALPGIESVRNAQQIQTYRGEARCGWKYGLRPLAFAERTIGDNSNVLRKFSDYRTTHIGAGLGYENPVLGKFDVTAERTENDYPRRDGSALAAQSGYRLDEIRLSARRDIGALLVANGNVAYSRLKPDTAATRSFKGVSWDIGATLTPGLRTQLRLGLGQSLKPSLGAEALFSRDRTYSLDVDFALTSRVSLDFGARRSERSYRGATAITGPLLTTDQFDSLSGGVAFRPSPRLRVRLEAGYERRKANGTTYDFSSRSIGLKTQFTL